MDFHWDFESLLDFDLAFDLRLDFVLALADWDFVDCFGVFGAAVKEGLRL